MTVDEKILAAWAANTEAIALVPSAMFKVPGNWQRLVRPYVIHFPVVEESTHTHDAKAAIQALRVWEVYQFSIIADTYSSGKEIAEKMRTVFNGNIDGVQFFYRGQRWVARDDDMNIGLMAVDFRIAETMPT